MGGKSRIVSCCLCIVFSSIVLISCLTDPAACGEYHDLIDMPALERASARHSLTLDICRAGRRLVTVGERGHILMSDNDGRTWTQARVNSRAHLNAVFFADERNGWAVGEDAVILGTADGGSTWNRLFDARDADPKGPLLDVWFRNALEGFAVGVYNKIFKTTDGGKSWVDWSEHVDNPDEWHLFAIAGAGDQKIWLASEQGLVFFSSDGGERFAPLQTVHYGTFHGILAKPGAHGNTALAAFGVGGVLFFSRDGGIQWSRFDTGTEAGLAGAAWLEDGTIVVVGYGGVLLRAEPGTGKVSAHSQENGLPLSAVTTAGSGKLILVGFGGPQTIAAPWQVTEESKTEGSNS